MSSPNPRPRERSANIFINYRREDSAGHAGRLFDALSSHFAGRLFMDVDTLEPGVDFVEAIDRAVGSCEALIVVIGREWLTIKDKAGRRRLDDPGDFVRLEVESALGRRIRVIPVLVQDAPMPSAEELPPSLAKLARRNAIELSDARWAYDADRLARTIQDILEESPGSGPAPVAVPEKATPPPVPVAPAVVAKPGMSRAWVFALAALVLVSAVVLAAAGWMRQTATPQNTNLENPTSRVLLADVNSSGAPVLGSPASDAPTGVAGNSAPAAGNDVPSEPVQAQAIDPRPASPAGRQSVREPVGSEPARRVEEPARVPPVSTPLPRTESVAVSFGNEPARNPAADPRPAVSVPTPSLQPARATIISPSNGEKVGDSVMVEGVASGFGDQRAFLCIRQKNGALYPRGELALSASGQWSIKLRSSKEKSFEILVVSTADKEAGQILNDQKSRDDGLTVLPAGAAISSGIVTLKKQGKFGSLLNPKGPDSRR